MIILDYFLLNEPQFTTALYTGLFLLLSAIIGLALRRRWVEGATWGFLILAGSADLAIFISRGLALPTTFFGPLVAAIGVGLILFLRLVYFTDTPARQPAGKMYVGVLCALSAVIWAGNILHPLPDSGFSSHHGVIPLYIQESFSLGHFVTIEDTAFGVGLMTALFYPADLLGLVALSGWLGASDVYPAFNAGSIAATILMFAILVRTLRESRGALVAFLILTLVMFTFDPFFRIVLGGNWGDVLMYLGGALVCYYLVQCEHMGRALLLAGVASTFLVFARHYGAFYSAVIIAFCFVSSWAALNARSFRPWFVVSAVWAVFSLRELYYLFGRFTPYYPGTWQADRRELTGGELFSGALTDWGLFNASDISLEGLSVRALYIVILALVLWRTWPDIKTNKSRIIAILSPLIVLVAPLALQTVTGYRTNTLYSKLYILGIFIFAWYPAYLMTIPSRVQSIYKYRRPLITAALFGVLMLGWVAIEKINPGRFVGASLAGTLEKIFKDNIPDREIVAALRSELTADEMRDVINTPVMYVYFEPGTSLRLYLGGQFLKDLDFWSVPVREKLKGAKSFQELLQKLGYPNLYIGLMVNGKVPDFSDPARAGIITEIENYKVAPWLDRVIEYGNAKFFIVRKPGS